MAVKTKEEILSFIRDRTKDSTDDETIGFIEDITDTLNDFSVKSKGYDELQKKYEENDKAWRKKYKERFFQSTAEDRDVLDDVTEKEETKKTKYKDLFKVEERNY